MGAAVLLRCRLAPRDRWFAAPRRGAPRKQASAPSAAPAPGHKAWMARSCRSRCMVAASTSYEALPARYHQSR